jgi:hypothetical protein
MHKQKILTIMTVFLGVLVLLLVQTEGFQDRNTPEWKAHLAAYADAQAAAEKKWGSEIAAAEKDHNFRAYSEAYNKKLQDTARLFSDEMHHSRSPNAGGPHPAVKKVQAVAPSQPVKNTKGVTPSQASTIPAKTK